MRYLQFCRWVCAWGLSLAWGSIALADDLPERCRVFLDTVKRCEQYDRVKTQSGWKIEYRLEIKKEGKPRDVSIQKPELDASVQTQILRYAEEQGIPVVFFDVSLWDQGLFKIGPQVSGEFAIEVRAKTISTRLNDLSIILDGLTEPGSFQFGGWNNTRNTLCLGKDNEAKPVLIEGSPDIKIKSGVWHRVRLEVLRDEIRGSVDGKIVVRAKTPKEYDFSKKRQPLFYVYASTAVVSDYRVERPSEPSPVEPQTQTVWTEIFGQQTPDQVMSDLTELCLLLNDPSYEVRESAHELLSRAGRLAVQPLQQAARSGALEGRERARSLLRQLGVVEEP